MALAGSIPDDVSPLDVRPRIGADVQALAEDARMAGAPWSDRTRIVVLADGIERWVGAMLPLLEVLGVNGLGTDAFPAPFVATASYTGLDGPALKDRSTRLGNWAARLGRPPRAVIAYQWVLLHPWDQNLVDRTYPRSVCTRRAG